MAQISRVVDGKDRKSFYLAGFILSYLIQNNHPRNQRFAHHCDGRLLRASVRSFATARRSFKVRLRRVSSSTDMWANVA